MASSAQKANPTNVSSTATPETVINCEGPGISTNSMSGGTAAPHGKTRSEVKFFGIHETKTKPQLPSLDV
jgi:hypothetical protein